MLLTTSYCWFKSATVWSNSIRLGRSVSHESVTSFVIMTWNTEMNSIFSGNSNLLFYVFHIFLPLLVQTVQNNVLSQHHKVFTCWKVIVCFPVTDGSELRWTDVTMTSEQDAAEGKEAGFLRFWMFPTSVTCGCWVWPDPGRVLGSDSTNVCAESPQPDLWLKLACCYVVGLLACGLILHLLFLCVFWEFECNVCSVPLIWCFDRLCKTWSGCFFFFTHSLMHQKTVFVSHL